ncbi:MAG: helix-turn-helix transcriptional regulator [Saprospirales bacterium]|nr:helix-turn-helix transcriptional regulator [Saprospirales bacterium]
MEPSFLADNIRNLRKSRNWSQEELAMQVGLNRGNIASYEKGTAEPKICNLLKLAHLFNVSILDLMGRDLRETTGKSNGVDSLLWMMNQDKWADYVEHAEELEKVVDGIFHCHCFKMKNINDADKDVKIISNQFDQLYEATRSLLKSHRELLGYMEQKVQSPDSQ